MSSFDRWETSLGEAGTPSKVVWADFSSYQNGAFIVLYCHELEVCDEGFTGHQQWFSRELEEEACGEGYLGDSDIHLPSLEPRSFIDEAQKTS